MYSKADLKAISRILRIPVRQNHLTLHSNGRCFIRQRYARLLCKYKVSHVRISLTSNTPFLYFLPFKQKNTSVCRNPTPKTIHFYSIPLYEYYQKLWGLSFGTPVRIRVKRMVTNDSVSVCMQLSCQYVTDLYSTAQNISRTIS